jgi:hypothetical protein
MVWTRTGFHGTKRSMLPCCDASHPPARRTTRGSLPSRGIRRWPVNAHARQLVVLVVDDDPGDALLIDESLERTGRVTAVHVADDGHAAVDFLRAAGGPGGGWSSLGRGELADRPERTRCGY